VQASIEMLLDVDLRPPNSGHGRPPLALGQRLRSLGLTTQRNQLALYLSAERVTLADELGPRRCCIGGDRRE
jgi:hypothetical protein